MSVVLNIELCCAASDLGAIISTILQDISYKDDDSIAEIQILPSQKMKK